MPSYQKVITHAVVLPVDSRTHTAIRTWGTVLWYVEGLCISAVWFVSMHLAFLPTMKAQ